MTALKDFSSKFKLDELTISSHKHWVVSVRPVQVTLGSLVISLKRSCASLGDISKEEAAELSNVFRQVELILSRQFCFDKINYLALMMIDEHVHFHVFPRYATDREYHGVTISDPFWPGPITDFNLSACNDEVSRFLLSDLSVASNGIDKI
jgi:diadenosine tetraphosphate (Ap4A) HIT family hydrolase